MPVKMTSIRLDKNLADEAAKVLGVKSRTEAVHVALREIVGLKRFKDLMRKHRGKLSFAGHDESIDTNTPEKQTFSLYFFVLQE